MIFYATHSETEFLYCNNTGGSSILNGVEGENFDGVSLKKAKYICPFKPWL